MKKITFILIALISGTTFAQSAKAKATTFAEIVEPLTITKTGNLDFGRIIGTAAGGTVTVNSDNTNTRSVSDAALTAPGGTVSSASFDITASDYNYSTTFVATVLKDQNSGGGADMVFTPKGSLTDDKGSGDITLYVGGDLAVGADQKAGNYAGSVEVTVTYE